MYAEAVDNAKLRMLAFEDRWHYVAILCCKAQGVLKGEPAMRERVLCIKLGLQPRDLSELKRRLSDVRLIDDQFEPVGWDKRQFQGDHSGADRMRKYRENNKKESRNVTVTSPLRNSDGLDTDTDSDSDTEQS